MDDGARPTSAVGFGQRSTAGAMSRQYDFAGDDAPGAGGTYRYPVFSDDAQAHGGLHGSHHHHHHDDADALAEDLHDHLDIEGDVDGLLDDEDDELSESDASSSESGRRTREDRDGPPPPHACAYCGIRRSRVRRQVRRDGQVVLQLAALHPAGVVRGVPPGAIQE